MNEKRHRSASVQLTDQWGLRKADLMRSKEGRCVVPSRAYGWGICPSHRCQGKSAEVMIKMRSGEREKEGWRGNVGTREEEQYVPCAGTDYDVFKEWAHGEGARVSRRPRMRVVGRMYMDLDMCFPNRCFC